MHWFVIHTEYYSRRTEFYDVFKDEDFKTAIEYLLRASNTIEELKDMLIAIIAYYFPDDNLENYITAIPNHDYTLTERDVELGTGSRKEIKEVLKGYASCERINVRQQLYVNYDVFADYIWSFKK